MNERAIEYYAYMSAMAGAISTMTGSERALLEEWERKNLDGRSVGTSDWPGWEKYIGAKPIFENESIDQCGFIYLIRCGETDRYKIGISKNVSVRLSTLQTGNPENLSLVCSFPTINARITEQELHRHYAKKRVAGEWFALNDDDLNYFKMESERSISDT